MVFMRAARVDSNQSEIVQLFRDLGWHVLIVSQLKACCDLFVSKHGTTIAIEVKDGSKPPSERSLTPGEARFKSEFKGRWELVERPDDVIRINQSIR